METAACSKRESLLVEKEPATFLPTSPAAGLRRRKQEAPEQLSMLENSFAFMQRDSAKRQHRREKALAWESWLHGSPTARRSTEGRSQTSQECLKVKKGKEKQLGCSACLLFCSWREETLQPCLLQTLLSNEFTVSCGCTGRDLPAKPLSHMGSCYPGNCQLPGPRC